MPSSYCTEDPGLETCMPVAAVKYRQFRDCDDFGAIGTQLQLLKAGNDDTRTIHLPT